MAAQQPYCRGSVSFLCLRMGCVVMQSLQGHNTYKWTNVRSYHSVVTPPQQGLEPCRLHWGTPGAALEKLFKLGQVLAKALTYAFQPWCGQPKSHLCLGGV